MIFALIFNIPLSTEMQSQLLLGIESKSFNRHVGQAATTVSRLLMSSPLIPS